MADQLRHAQHSGPVRHGTYPELTWHAVAVGWALGVLIALSIGYAALILGFSIEGSELAAILGWGILRGIMRRNSIIENNINQTVASAVNGASAGMMFSVPALFILAQDFEGTDEFNATLLVLACITGGIVGLSFIIPLRKQMIDFNRLAYPGGIAVATILKSPGAGLRKAALLLGGAVVSGAVHLLVLGYGLENLPAGDWLRSAGLAVPPILNLVFYTSLMTIGVGFLSGRGGLVFGYGGFICYWLLGPLLIVGGGEAVQNLVVAEGLNAPDALRVALFRPTGIGMLIGAAIGGIIAAAPLIYSAVRSMQQAAKEKGGGADEMPIWLLYLGIGGGALALVLLAEFSVPSMDIGRAVAMALLGTLWIWIAGVIVSECLGRTNWSPLSGMTLIAVTILILISTGLVGVEGIVSSVIVGAAICVAIAQAGDMMLDLKSGYLVGARPRMQQYAQFAGAWLGPIVIIGLIFVLHQEYGLGSDKLPAPQGQALASMIKGLVGGDAPVWRYTAGAGLGALLAFSGLGGIGVLIGLGFYMPFNIVLTYTIGAVTRVVLQRVRGLRWCEEVGIPVAAGLIVGEALIGVGYAIVRVIQATAGGA